MLSDDLGKMSYSIGANVGLNLAQKGFSEIKAEALVAGVVDALKGKGFQIDQAAGNKLVEEFMTRAENKKYDINKAEGEAFLAENAKRTEVTVLESGLQYEVITEGNGPRPTVENAVTAHYIGTLIDGKQFDSSVDRGQPVTFPLKDVIPGWIEGLQLMPQGSKWKLFIPSELAYGTTPPPGGLIEPHSALIFEVEVLKVSEMK